MVTRVAASCNSTPSEPGGTVEDSIIGDWTWVRSVGGLQGGEYTPATNGYNEYNSFRKNGVMEVLRVPDTMYHASRTLTYGITRRYYPMTQDTQYFLLMKEYPASQGYESLLEFHGKDTVVIGDDFADGLRAEWVRVKYK